MRGIVLAAVLAATPAVAHDIYSGVHGKDGQLCCGANDCEPTVYQERRGEFYFYTREKHWLRIPADRITFLPVPGDESNTESHRAHLCYRPTNVYDSNRSERVLTDDAGNELFLYCAFIAPGGI